MTRKLSTYAAVFLVVASMLGTGILTTTGIILSLVKTPEAALGVWVLGGVMALIGAWCYGELTRLVPRSGGEATILRELFSPWVGEIAGLTSFIVGFAACNAASALAFVMYLGGAFPGANLSSPLVASLVLLLVTSLHGLFGPLGLRIQTILATAKFILLAVLAGYGIFLAAPGMFHHQTASVLSTPASVSAGFGGAWAQAMMLVMFAYSGWNAAVYVAGEIHEPERNMRRILMVGTSIIVLLFISVNIVLLTQLPAGELSGVGPVVAALVKHFFGPQASSVFSGLVAFGLLSSLGVSAFLGPRVLAVMLGWVGKDANACSPVSEACSPVKTVVSPGLIWLQAGLSILMVLTGSFIQILTVMGFLLGLFPILSILTLYRRGLVLPGRSFIWVRYVLAPLFIGVSTIILALGASQSPREVLFALAIIAVFFISRLLHRNVIRA